MNYKNGIKLTMFLVIGAVTTLAWANSLPRSIEASTDDRGGVNCDCLVTWDITKPCPMNSELPCNWTYTYCKNNGNRTGMCKIKLNQAPCDETTDLCQIKQSKTCKESDCIINNDPGPGT